MSRQQPNQPEQIVSQWPHRLAWAAACAMLLLIWVGGNVTTYQAGGTIRDWPTTQGYWFYPLGLWLRGGWDLLLEQGHRMLAQLAFLLTVVLAVVVWRTDRRSAMRRLAAAAVAVMVFQVVVGGMRVVGGRVAGWLEAEGAPGIGVLRVLGDDVLLRRIHGCTAPLLLCLGAALVILTSPQWLKSGRPQQEPVGGRLRGLGPYCRTTTLAVLVGIYLMIVLGALLRHQPMDGGVAGFRIWGWLKPLSFALASTWIQFWVFLKLLGAGLLLMGLVWLLIDVLRGAGRKAMIVRRTKLLLALFFVQLVLAAATWVTNFGWPAWFTQNVWAIDYTVVQEGRLQVVVTTLHAALGSLNLVASVSLALWSRRLSNGRD